MIGTRPKRGDRGGATAPQGMTSKDALLYVDAGKVFYNGAEVTGLTLTPTGEKQIVSMGAYAVFFPDKKYLNTADITDHGGLDAAWTAEADTKIKYQLCKADGTEQTQNLYRCPSRRARRTATSGSTPPRRRTRSSSLPETAGAGCPW